MALVNLRIRNGKVFAVLAIIAALFNLALVGGLCWIAWHFISKWW